MLGRIPPGHPNFQKQMLINIISPQELNYTFVTPNIIPLTDSSQSQPTPEPETRTPELSPPQAVPQTPYSETPGTQQLPPALANIIPQPLLMPSMPSMPEMLPHPNQDLLPHPQYNMPVQRYPNQQNQAPPPQQPPQPQQPQQQQYHPVPPTQPSSYNNYNPENNNRNFEPPHSRNGRDNYSKRGEGGWNYRKGGHGGRQYREWIDSDRRRDDNPRFQHRPRRPCAYFNTKQGCREGNNCKFIHETGLHGSLPGQYNRQWDERDSRDGRDRGVHIGRDTEDKEQSKNSDKTAESLENKSPSAAT